MLSNFFWDYKTEYTLFVFPNLMQLSKEQITQFQLLYHEEFGDDISLEEANQHGVNLIRLIQLIYIPISREEFFRVQKEVIEISKRLTKKAKHGKVHMLT
jgi:hypothetical protein